MSREIDEADFDLGIKVCNLQHAIRPQQREQIVKSQNCADCKIVDGGADSRNLRSVTPVSIVLGETTVCFLLEIYILV